MRIIINYNKIMKKKIITIIDPKTGKKELVNPNDIGFISAEEAKRRGLTDNPNRPTTIDGKYFSDDEEEMSTEDYFNDLKKFLKENNYSYYGENED